MAGGQNGGANLAIEVVQLINKLALGDPAQIVNVANQWTGLGDMLDQRTGGSGSPGGTSVIGVAGQLANWTGDAADEFRTQSTNTSDYGRQLASAVGDVATMTDATAGSTASALVQVALKIENAQQVASDLDDLFLPLGELGTVTSWIQQAAAQSVLLASPKRFTKPLSTGATVVVDVPAGIVPVTASTKSQPRPASSIVTVVMPKNTSADPSVGSLSTTAENATADWLYPLVNEPLRAPATAALTKLTKDYNTIVAGMLTPPVTTGLPQKYDGSQSPQGTVGGGQYSTPNLTSSVNPAVGPANTNALNGQNLTSQVANSQNPVNQSLNGQSPSSQSISPTSLAGYDPSVSTPTLSTPTTASGLGTTGLGGTGVGMTDPLGSLGVTSPGGTSLSSVSPAAFAPGYFGGVGGSGSGADLTTTGRSGSTNPLGLDESATTAPESLLAGEGTTATTAASRSGMPPMYPPMMPPGAGQGGRDRSRGTYLPEDDIWTDDLLVSPGLITGTEQ
jgi:hypothetical protein